MINTKFFSFLILYIYKNNFNFSKTQVSTVSIDNNKFNSEYNIL